METLQAILPVLLTISLVALIFSVGLDARLSDLAYLFRRPALLLRAVLAVNVVVPVAAMAIIALFPGMSQVGKVGLLLMAASPVPPFVPGQQAKVSAARAYSHGLYAAMVVLTLITVPLSIAAFNRIYGVAIETPLQKVATNIGLAVVLPLVAGATVRRLAQGFATKSAAVVRMIAMGLLVVVIIPILVTAWPAVQALAGDGTFVAMALTVTVALVGGHLLGGAEPEKRSALAVTAAIRHPGIAMAIAGANNADRRIAAAVLGFVLVQLLASALYGAMLRRVRRPAPA